MSNQFSIECALQIGMQITKALRDIHESGYLHLDVKPDNILTCFSQNSTGDLKKIDGLSKNIYLIDFGCCQSFYDSKGEHRP